MGLCKVSKSKKMLFGSVLAAAAVAPMKFHFCFESDDKRKQLISRKRLLLDKKKDKEEERRVELFMCERGG